MRKALIFISGFLLIAALAGGAFAQAVNNPNAKFNPNASRTGTKHTGHSHGQVSNTKNWYALHKKAQAAAGPSNGHNHGATPNGQH